MAKEETTFARRLPGEATDAERDFRKGKKSLTETHLREQMKYTESRPDLTAKLEPQPVVPGTPSALPREVREQALRVEMARARNLPSGNRPAPKTKWYNVVHNGQEFPKVAAPNALEAWARVCDGEKNWPSPKTALVTEVDEDGNPVSDDQQSDKQERAEHAAANSPVANQNANEAAHAIQNMRSREKLQQIIDSDERKTVTDAAQKRLAELGDKAE